MKRFKQFITERVITIDDVDFDLGVHGEDRIKERSKLSAEEFKELLAKIRSKLSSLDIKGEFLFYSKKLRQGVVAAWDAIKSRLKLITFLPQGKHFAKPGTDEVVMECHFHELYPRLNNYMIVYID